MCYNKSVLKRGEVSMNGFSKSDCYVKELDLFRVHIDSVTNLDYSEEEGDIAVIVSSKPDGERVTTMVDEKYVYQLPSMSDGQRIIFMNDVVILENAIMLVAGLNHTTEKVEVISPIGENEGNSRNIPIMSVLDMMEEYKPYCFNIFELSPETLYSISEHYHKFCIDRNITPLIKVEDFEYLMYYK